MYLKRIKSLIENYNNECVKLTDNYSYYSRAFNTLKLILTPEEITEILNKKVELIKKDKIKKEKAQKDKAKNKKINKNKK